MNLIFARIALTNFWTGWRAIMLQACKAERENHNRHAGNYDRSSRASFLCVLRGGMGSGPMGGK